MTVLMQVVWWYDLGEGKRGAHGDMMERCSYAVARRRTADCAVLFVRSTKESDSVTAQCGARSAHRVLVSMWNRRMVRGP